MTQPKSNTWDGCAELKLLFTTLTKIGVGSFYTKVMETVLVLDKPLEFNGLEGGFELAHFMLPFRVREFAHGKRKFFHLLGPPLHFHTYRSAIMKMLKKSLLAIGVLAFGTLSQAAIVTQWSADVTGVWSDYSPATVTLSPDGKTLKWGTPSPTGGNGQQSALIITDPASDVLVNTYIGGGNPPPAFIAPSIKLTHNNFVITDVPSEHLTDATLDLSVGLTPLAPPGSLVGPLTVDYKIKFLETPNRAPCTVTSPTPCNDIFGLVDGLLNTSFDYDGQKYFVNAFPIEGGSLTSLSDAACADVGLSPGCLGFTTPENQVTELPFGFTISTAQLSVPEPGSVALIGLALAGMGLVSRRRSAKQTKA